MPCCVEVGGSLWYNPSIVTAAASCQSEPWFTICDGHGTFVPQKQLPEQKKVQYYSKVKMLAKSVDIRALKVHCNKKLDT